MPEQENINLPTRLTNASADDASNALSADNSHQQLTTGYLLKNRFELLEEIGRGGMGTVYKALDKRDIEAEHTTFLAVKILNDELQADNALLKALHSEAKKSQELAHPNIVTVYDFDREDNHIFMTMEFMDGVSLDQVIRSNPDGMPLDQALQIIDQLGAALAYAHSRHIIHSDFKPSNVFVTRDKRVKVIDFGIARVVKSERKERFDAGILRGLTPAYASLEMFLDQEPDPKDDIYALACVAYELLTGHHPYDRQRADSAKRQALEPKRPHKLKKRQWAVLRSGLQLDRSKRISDVTKFYQGLHANKTNPLSYVAAATVLLAFATLILLKEPLVSYWKDNFGQSSTIPPQQRPRLSGKEVSSAALLTVPGHACLLNKRTLVTLRIETQPSGTNRPKMTSANPGFSALVYRAITPYGVALIEVNPSSVSDHNELRKQYNLDYLLNVAISARDIPITTVKTAMKTMQGRISLQLLDLKSDRILNSASVEFKQPGLDLMDIVDKQFRKNVDALSAELFSEMCS